MVSLTMIADMLQVGVFSRRWGGSRGGSGGLVEPPKWNKRKYFDHTFSCEKKDLLNNNNNQIM